MNSTTSILSILSHQLPEEVFTEICEKWIDQDLYNCFTNHTCKTAWYNLWKKLIKQASREQKPIDKKLLCFLVNKCQVWETEFQYAPRLLLRLLRIAIQHNNMESIHLLMDTFYFLREPSFSTRLFFYAVKWNRPHLLRLFIGLWKFQFPSSFLDKCISWIRKNLERREMLLSCENECLLLKKALN